MQRNFLLSSLFLIITFTFLIAGQAAVTYELSGGRLGDDLLSYLHAKWISYIYKIPLFYKPFAYSDELALDDLEQYNPSERFKNSIVFQKNQPIKINPSSSTLYMVPYFPESLEEHQAPQAGINSSNIYTELFAARDKFIYFAVDWEDENFLREVRSMITPINTLPLIKPPKKCISVAVHVRKNSNGYDLPLLHEQKEHYDPKQKYADVIYPFKCVPDEYFIEQIKKIYNIFKNQPMYVFIFTDDINPLSIMNKYKKIINNDAITFDCRTAENSHDSNVLEDLFSMMNFDCLIRADSNLSIVASKLGKFKVVITPAHHRWDGRKLIIDEVHIKTKI